MKYWLMKSEPEVFSVDDLEARPGEPWDGVRNYQARNFLREMADGDRFLFYHSNSRPPGVVGVGEIIGAAEPDPSQFDPASEYFDPKSSRENPRWWMRRVRLVSKFPRMVTLEEIREDPVAGTMECARKGSRLSVHPVAELVFRHIVEIGS